LALAQAGGICLHADFIFPPADMLSPMDLCIILSNGLDNALEACGKFPAGSPERKIQAKSYVRHSCLLLEIISHKQEARLFRTTKKDPHFHGIGLTNIREAVERCHGTLDFTVTDYFHFCAMLPLPLREESPRLLP
jgi:sensor histidine kinase regulating citrate/malate metabolism